MAISSTLCGALLVENGQRLHSSDGFVIQQWLWFDIAAVPSAFLGGELVAHMSPGGALHMAAAIIAIAPFAAIFVTVFLIDEPFTTDWAADYRIGRFNRCDLCVYPVVAAGRRAVWHPGHLKTTNPTVPCRRIPRRRRGMVWRSGLGVRGGWA